MRQPSPLQPSAPAHPVDREGLLQPSGTAYNLGLMMMKRSAFCQKHKGRGEEAQQPL